MSYECKLLRVCSLLRRLHTHIEQCVCAWVVVCMFTHHLKEDGFGLGIDV